MMGRFFRYCVDNVFEVFIAIMLLSAGTAMAIGVIRDASGCAPPRQAPGGGDR